MTKSTSVARLSKILIIAVLVMFCACTARADEYRAFWVDAWGAGALNQGQVDTLMGVVGNGSSLGKIREANCNMVIVQVRRNCDANYPSSMGEPYMGGLTPSNFNSLQAVINAAHDTTGGKKRVEVHAWIVTFRTSGGAVYAAHSSTPTGSLTNLDNYWPSRTSAGAETSDKAFDPGHPLAEEYTVNVCMDLVNNFDIDGIHYDYIRFTGGDQGYNPTSIARYNARYGLTGQPSSTNDQFDQWRRDQISNMVRKVYAKTQASKPNVKVSGAFVTWNPSPTASTRAAFETTRPFGNRTDGVFSDWDAWMQEGIVDLSIPMTYYNYASLPADWTKWMNFIKDRQFNRQALIGPGIYLNSLSNAILELQQTRLASPSGNYAKGFAGYSYRLPYASGTWANFSPQLVSQVTPTWADIPPMPWKTTPTKGHISGTVTDAATTKWIDGGTVSITGPESRSMFTDGTGFYAFIDLAPGSYTLTASKPGYPNAVRTVVVAVGAVTGNMYVTDIPLGGTPDIIAPTVPTGLSATAVSGTRVNLTWTASTDNVAVTGYKVFRGGVQIGTSATASYSDTTCTPATTYSYQVSAYDAATNESAKSTAAGATTPDTIPPSVPMNLDAMPMSGTRVDLTWPASTDNVAVTGYKVFRGGVQIGASATASYSDTTCTPATTYSYQVSAYDAVPNESAKSTGANVTTFDVTAPVMTSVTDEMYTTSTASLQATWAATEPESAIMRYDYAVGSSANAVDIRGWTDAGVSTAATISGLSLTVGGTYFISVRAVNDQDLVSDPMCSAGVTIAHAVASIAAAKGYANGTPVAIALSSVSARFAGAFYMQDASRASGIRVDSADGPATNYAVQVFGRLALVSGCERSLVDCKVVSGALGAVVEPLLLNIKAVGGLPFGSYTPGVNNATGLNNVSLLIAIAGNATALTSDGFYLDDGSGVQDDSANKGIKVWTGAANSVTQNHHYVVIGIASCRVGAGGVVYAQLLSRDIVER